jgi:aromatic-L-amino-acid decarboxylase
MLRSIPTDARHRIRISELRGAIAADREAGLRPFVIVGTAGTVDIGAIDDLDGLSDLASGEGLWFHVDGAFGALAILAPDLASRLKGIERADSIAFDFHKWAQVPYDAGFLLVRDGRKQIETFAMPAAYLRREMRGTAAGSPWPCDFGPDLSRGFRALKTWFTLKVYGTARLGAVISRTCQLAQYLRRRVEETSELELAAPVQLNIVCFRYRLRRQRPRERRDCDGYSGIRDCRSIDHDDSGRLAIRAAIVNHRTQRSDLDALIDAVVKAGGREAPQKQSAAISGKRGPRTLYARLNKRYYLSNERIAWGAELACARAAVPACTRICALLRLAASAARSASRIRDSAAASLVTCVWASATA